GTSDAPAESTVDDAVPGAAGAAHGEGADEEQDQMPEVDRGAGLDGSERHRPPARQQQQPGADRPVEAGEPQIGPRPGGGEAVDPVSGRGGDAARAGRQGRASGLVLSGAEGPEPRLGAGVCRIKGGGPGASAMRA